jgi:hypothetical protein
VAVAVAVGRWLPRRCVLVGWVFVMFLLLILKGIAGGISTNALKDR